MDVDVRSENSTIVHADADINGLSVGSSIPRFLSKLGKNKLTQSILAFHRAAANQ